MPAEKTRTTHVWRQKKPENDDIWLDLERVDEFVSQEGQGPGYQKTTRKLFWGDETGEEPHPTRTQREVRIENPDDADTFVPLKLTDKMVTQRGQGPGFKKSTKKYVNDRETNTVREVSIRRVYHWDTATDPGEDGGKNYIRTPGTEDRSQYVDTAVIERSVSTQGQGPGFKKRTMKFNTDPIKEFSEPSPADVDMTKVIYLEPWQNIINVQWSIVEFVTISISLFLIWQPTEEYVHDGGGSCSPSLGYTPNDNADTSTIHFEASDAGTGAPETNHGIYRDGELVSGGGGTITGLNYPFPISVDLAPWLFVGIHTGAPNSPVLRMKWEDNEDGAIIVDRKGNPVEAFSGDPFRRGDVASFKVRGRAFTSGPQCWQNFGGPGGDVPRTQAFVEPVVGSNYITVIPGSEAEISISSISVEYEGETFQGCGYYAGGSDLQIICEKIPT